MDKMTLENFGDPAEIEVSDNGHSFDPTKHITHDITVTGKGDDGKKIRKVFPAGTPKKEVDEFFASIKKQT